jgi:serine protease Do
LVDVEGKMIGLNAAYISSHGIAIRASKVKNVVNELIKGGSIKEAYIGIVTDEISLPRDIGAQLEPSQQEEGLIVLSVEKDTAAKKAGLLMGDIIVKFDNDPITNIHDLRQLLKPNVIGKSVKLGIIRGEKELSLQSLLKKHLDPTNTASKTSQRNDLYVYLAIPVLKDRN